MKLLSTLLLVLIWILFFAGLYFIYQKERMIHLDLNENFCSSYFKCFLTYVTEGIRIRNPSILSLENPLYYSAFVVDWIFYFIIVVILFNCINATIVVGFQGYREANAKKLDEEKNVCQVCKLTRKQFEMRGYSFDFHTDKEHNFLNYTKFLIGLLLENELELNSAQSTILQKIKKIQTDFFPFKKALSLK